MKCLPFTIHLPSIETIFVFENRIKPNRKLNKIKPSAILTFQLYNSNHCVILTIKKILIDFAIFFISNNTNFELFLLFSIMRFFLS